MASRAIPSAIVTQMRHVIAPLDTPDNRERYRTGQFPRADRVKDLDKRYRWDLYWSAMYSASAELRSALGWHLDSHIDTALRRIVPPLAEV